MLRTRTIAASPARSSSQTWATICTLIGDTLDRSPHIHRVAVEEALRVAAGAGLALVAGGHLDKHAVTVVAAPMQVAISTISGTASLSLEENLNPVPGAATSTTWKIHLPTPDPLASYIEEIVKRNPHLTTAEPEDVASTTASTTAGLDLAAVSRRLGGGA